MHGAETSGVKQANGSIVCPTSFPNPVNYGMAWNKTSFLVLGQVIATETRALWLAGATEFSAWSGYPHVGLDVWCVNICICQAAVDIILCAPFIRSPNINQAIEPRWGRNQVCFGP